MMGYYDIVLGLIPLALVGITGTLALVGIALTTAVSIAAAVAVALIGHAMFVNAPIDESSNASQSGTQTQFNSAD